MLVKNKDDSGGYKRSLSLAYYTLSDPDKRADYDKDYEQAKSASKVESLASASADGEDPKQANSYFLGKNENDIDEMVFSTKKCFDELNSFVNENLSVQGADASFKNEIADSAEQLYRRGMWPLLGKIKELVGEADFTYVTICELHCRAVLSLGDLCMWAARYDRAIGMYNTALALSGGNKELAEKCAKAVKFAREVYENSRLKTPPLAASVKQSVDGGKFEEVFISYWDVAKWVFVGTIFILLCLWGAVTLVDFMLVTR